MSPEPSGTGYLFALFQELCGDGIEDVGRVETGREWADIASLRQTLEARAVYKELPFEWYFRLRLACDVAEKTRLLDEQTSYSQGMINGIRLTLDDMLVRLSIIHSDSPTCDSKEKDKEGKEVDAQYTQRVKDTAKVFCDAAKESGILNDLAEIREKAAVPGSEMVSNRPEQPSRYPVFADEARARLIEFYVERKLANVQRPLHKVIALGRDEEIKASELRLKSIKIEDAKDQLSKARGCPLAAADAVVKFADLYLYGEEVIKERKDLRVFQDELDLPRNCAAPLTTYRVAKENGYGHTTNCRIPSRGGARCTDERVAA